MEPLSSSQTATRRSSSRRASNCLRHRADERPWALVAAAAGPLHFVPSLQDAQRPQRPSSACCASGRADLVDCFARATLFGALAVLETQADGAGELCQRSCITAAALAPLRWPVSTCSIFGTHELHMAPHRVRCRSSKLCDVVLCALLENEPSATKQSK